MRMTKILLLSCLALMRVTTAQETAEEAAAEREASIKVEVQMREAEEQLAEAARKIAELSRINMPRLAPEVAVQIEQSKKPRLGVTISGVNDDGPVDGVRLAGITPGSAAADAGLRAGDIITAINNESMSGSSSMQANERLIEFMAGVEEGDKLDIEYKRDGNVGVLGLTPKVTDTQTFIFEGGSGQNYEFFGQGGPEVVIAPNVQRDVFFSQRRFWGVRSWSDMELVELSAELGEYFGTDSGLLVISVGEKNELKLRDGDVIKSVDDREPDSIGHLMRILGSYEAGETLEIRIMRDKKRQSITLEMPDARTGALFPMPPLAPAPIEPANLSELVQQITPSIRT